VFAALSLYACWSLRVWDLHVTEQEGTGRWFGTPTER